MDSNSTLATSLSGLSQMPVSVKKIGAVEMTAEEMAIELTEVDQRSRSNTKRLDKLENQVDTLRDIASSTKVMAEKLTQQGVKMDDIKKDVSTLNNKVSAIEQAPAKRWNGVVEKIIYGIVGAAITALVAAIINLI